MRVLVFGTFDGLHEGHRAFLREAMYLGSELVTIVAQDATVENLKGRIPKFSLKERMDALGRSGISMRVAPGDMEQGKYHCIKMFQPDIICLGYDQHALKRDIERWMQQEALSISLIVLSSYQPNKFKSSLLNTYD